MEDMYGNRFPPPGETGQYSVHPVAVGVAARLVGKTALYLDHFGASAPLGSYMNQLVRDDEEELDIDELPFDMEELLVALLTLCGGMTFNVVAQHEGAEGIQHYLGSLKGIAMYMGDPYTVEGDVSRGVEELEEFLGGQG